MRIRSIKPEFWRSDDVANLDWDDRLLFIGLWSYVDDNGVGINRLSSVVADLFAADLERSPSDTFARVSRGLSNLVEVGLIVSYEVDGKPYLEVTGWSKHQRIDHPNKPRFPRSDDESAVIRETLAKPREILAPGTGEQGNRGTGEQGTSPKGEEAPPPASAPATRKKPAVGKRTRLSDDFTVTPAMVTWANENCPAVNGKRSTERFINHFGSVGGTAALKVDWVKAWRNWLLRDQEQAEREQLRTQSSGRATGLTRGQEKDQAAFDFINGVGSTTQPAFDQKGITS